MFLKLEFDLKRIFNAKFDFVFIFLCCTVGVALKTFPEVEYFSFKKDALDMILNCIWWWGSSSWDLRSVESHFIAISPRYNLIWSGNTC